MVIKIKFNLNNHLIKYNTFEELIQLENYNDIKYINCSYNNCSYNNLTSLPNNLPNSLERLYYNNLGLINVLIY